MCWIFTLSSIIFFGDDFCTEPKMPVVAKALFRCGIKMWASIIKNIRCSSHAVQSALLDVPDERGGPL